MKLIPNASYSIVFRLRVPHRAGMLASVLEAIAAEGGVIGEMHLDASERGTSVRTVIVDSASSEQSEAIEKAVRALPKIEVMECYDRTFKIHEGGKIHIENTIPLKDVSDLSMAYTPGVGRVCKAIEADPEMSFTHTIRKNMVAVVSDGSAVLGLGNLGALGAMPVMEGKAMLFKSFAGVDAFPICLDTQDPDEIVTAVKWLAPTFGGINLEDISAPRCFDIEERLKKDLDIPVFHDDQHGTAVVVMAALYNSLKLLKRKMEDLKVVISGAGAAGIAIGLMLRDAGVKEIVLCDSRGIVSDDREGLNRWKLMFSSSKGGSLSDALEGADLFIGVSAPGIMDLDMLARMKKDPMIFAMSNPVPEIQPELVEGKVSVMATGRSDYPNQINNVLAFPGIFRGAMDCRSTEITMNMKLAAAKAIAACVPEDELCPEKVVPSVFHPGIGDTVAKAVIEAAKADGVARK